MQEMNQIKFITNPIELPNIGTKYYYVDKGEISFSTRLKVLITEHVPFTEIDEETLSTWQEEVKHNNIFNKETDYFIKGELKVSDSITKPVLFVRCSRNAWFSIGECSGRLDVRGNINENLMFYA